MGEEILPLNPNEMIEHDKFTYFPLGKTFETQTKKVDEQEEKQIKAIKSMENNQLNLVSLIKE